MNITANQYTQIIEAGIAAERGNLNGFAEACYNSNSAGELLAALSAAEADKEDCAAWNLTSNQWRSAITECLAHAAWEYKIENDIDA